MTPILQKISKLIVRTIIVRMSHIVVNDLWLAFERHTHMLWLAQSHVSCNIGMTYQASKKTYFTVVLLWWGY